MKSIDEVCPIDTLFQDFAPHELQPFSSSTVLVSLSLKTDWELAWLPIGATAPRHFQKLALSESDIFNWHKF